MAQDGEERGRPEEGKTGRETGETGGGRQIEGENEGNTGKGRGDARSRGEM